MLGDAEDLEFLNQLDFPELTFLLSIIRERIDGEKR